VQKSKSLRTLFAVAGVAACALVSLPARAASPQSLSALVNAQPALGTSQLSSQGLSELMVHVEWPGTDDLTISVESAYQHGSSLSQTKVRFDKSLTVVVPVDPSMRYSSELAVVVRDHSGFELGRGRASTGTFDSPIVVSLDPRSTVADALSGSRIEFVAPQSYSTNKTIKQIVIAHPPVADGLIRAPEHATGYHDATLVLAKDTTIDALTPSARNALLEWVKLGGHIAIEETAHDAARGFDRRGGRTVALGGGTVFAFSAGEDAANARAVTEEVRRSAEQRGTSFVADPTGNGYQFDSMRRTLDPNENFRPALGVAALLLIAYAIVVGPLLHRRARKRKKPMELLYTMPIASASAFVLILLLGVFTKGLHGRSRRLTFVDLTSGESEGNARTFRAFYSNRSSSFDIDASSKGALPRLVHTGLGGEGEETLRVDGDTATLSNVTLPPWQTAVVIDDGRGSIDGAIDVDYTSVHNGTPYTLRNVFVQQGEGACTFFTKISAGDKVAFSSGAPVWNGCAAGSIYTPRQPAVYQISSMVPREESQDFSDVWNAVINQAGQVDVVPPNETVLFAEVEGKKGPSFDSGLYVDKSRTLVRVRLGGYR
jgi:hypothetical protein